MSSRSSGLHKIFAFICTVFVGAYDLSPQSVDKTYSGTPTIGAVTVMATDSDATNVINLSGEATINGNVIFGALANSTLKLNIAGLTYLKPTAPSVGAQYGHLILYAARGAKITVDVSNDLIFTGYNSDSSGTAKNDLTLTFSGEGQVEFEIATGKKVSLDSLYENSGSYFATNSTAGAGVRSFIIMDQPDDDVFKDGVSKVVFSRKFAAWDDEAADMAGDTTVEIGKNSFLTFAANNKTGLDPASAEGIANGESIAMLSAALAFDVSCAGEGRMLLKLNGVASSNTYRDGALSVCGNLIEDGANAPGLLTNADHIRQHVKLNKPAGGYALLRVIDEKAYQYPAYRSGLGDALADYLDGGAGVAQDADGNPSARGLWVVNTCNSYPAMASNPYDDDSWYTKEIFTGGKGNSEIRPGFVVGVNGHLEVFHNTFMHHLACENTRAIDTAAMGMSALGTKLSGASSSVGAATKKHNPSALIVDGLATYAGLGFKAHEYDTNAKITLLGSGKLFVSSGVASVAAGGGVTAPNYTVGTGVYDGEIVPLSGNIETGDEGEHVLDVQGYCTIRSFIDDALTSTAVPFRRHNGTMFGQYTEVTLQDNSIDYDPIDGGLGDVTIGSVRINHTGTVVNNSGTEITSRPLTKGVTYARYNRGCINLNNDLALKWARINHTDVSRKVDRDHTSAPPAIVGGEYAVYSRDVLSTAAEVPTIWLENADFHLHENLAISGARIAVAEISNPGANPATSTNSSYLYLYNHGNDLDLNVRGYGRVLQLGTANNKLAGGGTDDLLKNAYINVFKHSVGVAKAELLLDTAFDAGVLNTNEKAFQVLHLGNESYISLGWTSTQGIILDNNSKLVYPWENKSVPIVSSGWTLFSLDSTANSRASLIFNGEFTYLSASGSGGYDSPELVSTATTGRVLYVNHGGAISASAAIQGTNNDSFTPRGTVDITTALRVAQSTSSSYNPVGEVSTAHDQVRFLKSIQPYNIDPKFAETESQHIDLGFMLNKKGLASDLTVPWASVKRETSVPFKSTDSLVTGYLPNGLPVRSVGIQTNAAAMPASGLLKLGAGAAVEQLRVSGATRVNPLLLYLSGDTTGHASVRELTSVASKAGTFAPGEGGNAAIFMDKDARVGIGSRSWNSDSNKAWNLLGKGNVTLVPNGDAFVELNSDVIIADAQPFIPTTNFGNTTEHRLTFFSQDTHEIRVPAGGELDLSAFGNVSDGTKQQITLGGKVRLIFEAGSTLRFPALSHSGADQAPVLYVNDSSQLIFEGLEERDSTRLAAKNLSDTDNIKAGRSRIMGVGRIWLNKNAVMKVMETAVVGIEADSTTPETDILISIQKEAGLFIGDQNIAGGVLQVGNPVDMDTQGFSNKNIYFTLRLDGPRSTVHIDRNGILGLGAGVKSRYHDDGGKLKSRINGTTVRSLFNVADVTIRSIRGSFSHNQIYDGSESEASLLAIGPSDAYSLDLGTADESIWRGGGNMVYVTEDATNASPLTVSVLSAALALSDEYNRNASGDPTTANAAGRLANNGKATIMGSGIITRQITQDSLPLRGPTRVVQKLTAVELAILGESTTGKLLGGKHFTGPQPDMFRYLSFTQFKDQTPSKYCVLGSTQFEFKIGFVTGTTIRRETTIPLLGVKSPEGAAKVGALLAATVDSNGDPFLYTLPEVPKNPNIQLGASQ
jgi:hypothetical protein